MKPDCSQPSSTRSIGVVGFPGDQQRVGVGDGAPAGQQRREFPGLGLDRLQPRRGGVGCRGVTSGHRDPDAGDGQGDQAGDVRAAAADGHAAVDVALGSVELVPLEVGERRAGVEPERLGFGGPASAVGDVLGGAGPTVGVGESAVDHVEQREVGLCGEFGQAEAEPLALGENR